MSFAEAKNPQGMHDPRRRLRNGETSASWSVLSVSFLFFRFALLPRFVQRLHHFGQELLWKSESRLAASAASACDAYGRLWPPVAACGPEGLCDCHHLYSFVILSGNLQSLKNMGKNASLFNSFEGPL